MNLISCYIEGFGKLKAKEYSFHAGVNCFCEENGAGKSTLASFIKAMFYGLDSYRKDTKEFCDRQHFYPFDGGEFGGNLVFAWNGKTYKIERFFGEKSETADTLNVYSNGEKTEELGTDIGKTVFGIDRASFERTLFIDADEIELSSTTAINAKLNNVLQGTTEDTNLDSALKRLETRAKEYKKAKAGKDKISEETSKIALLQSKIDNAEKTRTALYEKMDALEKLDQTLAEKDLAIATAQKTNAQLEQWEHYQTLTETATKKQSRLKALRVEYPFGLPTEVESASVQSLLTKEGNLRAQGKNKAFTDTDESRLQALSLRFATGVPSDQTLEEIGVSIERVSAVSQEIRLLEQTTSTDEEKRLVHTFGAYLPTPETISETEIKVTECRRLEREYHELPTTVSVANGAGDSKKRNGLLYGLIGVMSALVLVLGLALLGVAKPAGVALAVIGGVALLADGFAYLNKKSERVQTVELENPEKRKKADELRETENAVRAVLLPYGYNSDHGLAFDFETFKRDIRAYVTYREREQGRLSEIEKKRAEAQVIEERLFTFFRQYGAIGETHLARYNGIIADIGAYESLSARKRECLTANSELQDALARNRVQIDAYLRQYRLTEDRVQSAIEDARESVKLEREIAEDLARAEAYKKEKNLTEKPLQSRLDMDALQAEVSLLRAQRSRLALDIETDETVAQRLGEYEAERMESEERLAEYKNRYRLLTATSALLEKAEQNLKDKYVKPIKDEFVYYARLLEDALGEKVSLSRNFEVSFERNGKERTEKHLSAGQREICALCFRLALIRNMYKGQTPFLVLDDPFTALDAVHMARVQRLVKTLANDMQIVYFVCHDSRQI